MSGSADEIAPMSVCTACGHQPMPLGAEACSQCGSRQLVLMRSHGAFGAGLRVGRRYVLLSPLGSGGVGTVYRAVDLALRRTVALKVLHGEWTSNENVRRRFDDEAAHSARLSHPHNIKVHDYGHTDEGQAYLAMELVQGVPLSELPLPMPAARAIGIAEQVASALAEAHELGLVHRDLKPGNIMVSQVSDRDFVRVLDYGIAKALDSQTVLTRPGGFVGTPDYAAPEQVSGESTLDGRVDVYALGCVLFELLTGRPPFPRQDLLQTLWAHRYEAPASPAAAAPMSAALDALVLQCLAKDPADRPPSMTALRARIEALPEWRVTDPRGPVVQIGGAPPPPDVVPPVAVPPTHSSPAKRRSWRLIGMAATLLIIGIALVVLALYQAGIGRTDRTTHTSADAGSPDVGMAIASVSDDEGDAADQGADEAGTAAEPEADVAEAVAPEDVEPTTATVEIQSNIAGASIEIGGVERGTTLYQLPTRFTVEPGPTRVVVTMSGYDAFSTDVEPEAGDVVVVDVTLEEEERIEALTDRLVISLVTSYYDRHGQWAGVYTLSSVRQLRVDRRSEERAVAHVRYFYSPVRGGGAIDHGEDWRTFDLSWRSGRWRVTGMGEHHSARF